ncbi:unnamed protein product [Effrenium voratum]|nr:unnamed protein product [Effrenium voratum]
MVRIASLWALAALAHAADLQFIAGSDPYPRDRATFEAQLKSKSEHSTPVPVDTGVMGDDSNIADLFYYVVNPDGSRVRTSWGFQYYDAAQQRLAYQQLFRREPVYDRENPGGEMLEYMSMVDGSLLNVNINWGGHAECIYAPPGFVPKLPTMQAFKDRSVNVTYVASTSIQDPKTEAELSADVYVVEGLWFNGAPLYYYIDRSTGQLRCQLYFQSQLEQPGPNYFWWMYENLDITDAQAKFAGDDDKYYFGFPQSMVDQCPDGVKNMIPPQYMYQDL